MKRRNRRIVECLLVLLLVCIAGCQSGRKAKTEQTRKIVDELARGVMAYCRENRRFPARLEYVHQCKASRMSMTIPAGSFIDGQYVDAFGNPLHYERLGGENHRPVIISGGADGKLNTILDNVRVDIGP